MRAPKADPTDPSGGRRDVSVMCALVREADKCIVFRTRTTILLLLWNRTVHIRRPDKQWSRLLLILLWNYWCRPFIFVYAHIDMYMEIRTRGPRPGERHAPVSRDLSSVVYHRIVCILCVRFVSLSASSCSRVLYMLRASVQYFPRIRVHAAHTCIRRVRTVSALVLTVLNIRSLILLTLFLFSRAPGLRSSPVASR